MFCSRCGAKIDDDSKFCENCGVAVRARTSENKFSDETAKGVLKYSKKANNQWKSHNVARRHNFVIGDNIFLKLSWTGIAMCALCVISTFFPFMRVTVFGSTSEVIFFEGDGKIFAAIAIIEAICLLKAKTIFSIILGVIAMGMSVFEAIYISNLMAEEYIYTYTKCSGYYLMFITSAALLLIPIALLYLTNRQ